YSSSARTARKTVCIANWDDPEQSYSSVVEYLQDDELLQRLGYNPVDLRLLGVTSRGQALRAAKHTLFSNRYETETVSFRIAAEG
ncbi:phage tail protein, partial [Mycobacterium tuberculosis]|uniref:phage tail protein n=1 Tax=Mycobacterium tuberculosis TaxID=1773 RepID=UPI00254FDC72